MEGCADQGLTSYPGSPDQARDRDGQASRQRLPDGHDQEYGTAIRGQPPLTPVVGVWDGLGRTLSQRVEVSVEYVAVTAKEGRQTLIEFPDCPGCQTFADPGENVAEVAREALEGWLAVSLERGDAPPRPTTKAAGARKLRVRIEPALAIALQLRWRRQELGLSQAQLGKRLDVSRQQVALLEKPSANLRLSTLARAAEALELVLDVGLAPATAPRD